MGKTADVQSSSDSRGMNSHGTESRTIGFRDNHTAQHCVTLLLSQFFFFLRNYFELWRSIKNQESCEEQGGPLGSRIRHESSYNERSALTEQREITLRLDFLRSLAHESSHLTAR